MFELINKSNSLGEIDGLFNKIFDNQFNFYHDFKSDAYFSEDSEFYSIDMALPGVNKEDVNLSIENGYLCLQYENKTKSRQSSVWINDFRKKIKLPTNASVKNIEAKMQDGILSVLLKKKKENISRISIK